MSLGSGPEPEAVQIPQLPCCHCCHEEANVPRNREYLRRKAERRSRKEKIIRRELRSERLAREQRECAEIARNAKMIETPDAPLPRPALVVQIKEVDGKIVLDPEVSSSPPNNEERIKQLMSREFDPLLNVNSSTPVSSSDGSSE